MEPIPSGFDKLFLCAVMLPSRLRRLILNRMRCVAPCMAAWAAV